MPTIDLIEKRLIPQTPCPEVQPPPILVPNPTKKPAIGIKTKELVTLNSIFEGEIIIINKGPKTPAKKIDTRLTYWDSWVESPIFERADLQSYQEIMGPAIIEEYGSTIVVPSKWFVRRDDYGNLIMRKKNQLESK